MRQLSFNDRLHPLNQSASVSRRRINWNTFSKKLYQRKRFILLLTGLTISLLVIGIWLSQPGTAASLFQFVSTSASKATVALGMQVKHIYLEGRYKTSAGDLLKALDVNRGDPIINFDANEARERLESLGWVHSAIVKRKLPDAIHLKITERRPFALWQNQGQIVLIDRQGAVIDDSNLEPFTHLPLIVGKEAREAAPELFDIIAKDSNLFGRVLAVVHISNRRWDIVFEGGLRVHLPESDISGAWIRLATANSEQDFFNSDVAAIDLRAPDRMILKLDSQSSKQGETT